ncbi:MAG: pilus assembly protein TadG-related protein, partial [Gimesia sp.]|nr:pilus assembly protein TadG-related protein [Gimesia sp.]
MKSISMKQKHQTYRNLSRAHRARRGSTLLVVIALLAILALMGVVFYTFSSQERSNAENFADAAINEADPGLQADALFNWG